MSSNRISEATVERTFFKQSQLAQMCLYLPLCIYAWCNIETKISFHVLSKHTFRQGNFWLSKFIFVKPVCVCAVLIIEWLKKVTWSGHKLVGLQCWWQWLMLILVVRLMKKTTAIKTKLIWGKTETICPEILFLLFSNCVPPVCLISVRLSDSAGLNEPET